MTSSIESRVEEYRRLRLGHLRVLAVRIEQVPFELGEPQQSIEFEFLKGQYSGRVQLKFTGVQDLKTDGRIHPGSACRLEIVPVGDHQLEGIRFYVFNDEPNDFEFRFYCFDFVIGELPVSVG